MQTQKIQYKNTMKEEQVEKQNVEINDIITKAEAFIEKYKNTILIVVATIVVVVLGYFGLKKWYFEPREKEAAGEMFMAENYFDNYDYEKALNGDQTTNALGFIDIISDYSGTKTANLARYYAGICELRLGQYEEAIGHLKKYSGKDAYTKALAVMAIGDAQAELGDNDEAIKYYEKAAKIGDNDIVAPTALYKTAILYIANQQGDKAVAALEQIKEKYPQSTEYSEVDKYIAVAESMK